MDLFHVQSSDCENITPVKSYRSSSVSITKSDGGLAASDSQSTELDTPVGRHQRAFSFANPNYYSSILHSTVGKYPFKNTVIGKARRSKKSIMHSGLDEAQENSSGSSSHSSLSATLAPSDDQQASSSYSNPSSVDKHEEPLNEEWQDALADSADSDDMKRSPKFLRVGDGSKPAGSASPSLAGRKSPEPDAESGESLPFLSDSSPAQKPSGDLSVTVSEPCLADPAQPSPFVSDPMSLSEEERFDCIATTTEPSITVTVPDPSGAVTDPSGAVADPSGTVPAPDYGPKVGAIKDGARPKSGAGSGPNIMHQLKNFIAPNYKYRNEEFKRLFKVVPASERLVLDYSCAYQKEILIHGRMYLSQNWLCFHANIFSWETTLTIPFKDIADITKEKTAKVIPNAIQITIANGKKYFFTSFATRDKTHLVVFRLWQSSLLDQWEHPADMWAWANQGYNESELNDVDSQEHTTSEDADDAAANLTLASDDVEKSSTINVDTADVDVAAVGGKRRASTAASGGGVKKSPVARLGIRSALPLTFAAAQAATATPTLPMKPSTFPLASSVPSFFIGATGDNATLTQSSVTTLADEEMTESSNDNDDMEISCSCVTHDGKEMLNEIYPISVDQLFLLLFTDSPFFRRLQQYRKTNGLLCGEWHTDKLRGVKIRQLSYTVTLSHAMGPKSCAVTEKQICAQCSKTGKVYVIKCEAHNSGIPYADSFYVVTTYCLSHISAGECRLRLHGAVAYSNRCWGIVKSFIEKNALAGLQDYFNDLDVHLKSECENLGFKRKSLKSHISNIPDEPTDSALPLKKDSVPASPALKPAPRIIYPLLPTEIEHLTKGILVVLVLMLLLNGALFYKIWRVEADIERRTFDATLYNLKLLLEKPDSRLFEWQQAIKDQRKYLHTKTGNWAQILSQTTETVSKIEEMLKNLRELMLSLRKEGSHNNMPDFSSATQCLGENDGVLCNNKMQDNAITTAS